MSSDSTRFGGAPAAHWPRWYRGSTRMGRLFALQSSALMMGHLVAGGWKKVFRSVGVVLVAIAGGLGLAALDQFREGWELYAVFFVIPLVIGVVGGIVVVAPKLRSNYAFGAEATFEIGSERFHARLNRAEFGGDVEDIGRVHRFGNASLLTFNDGKALVVPSQVLPGWTK